MLLVLYDAYQTHPHLMLSPKEVMDAAGVTHDELVRNIFYLEEHGLVECLKGFGTALFGAAKLTAQGVDVVEDEEKLNELFPVEGEVPSRPADELSELFERIRIDARIAPLGQEDIDTLIDELEFIRRSLERTRTPERMRKIETLFGWITASFDGNESVLRDICRLMEIIREE
jgi:DNA-binding MarR family transcriptional regulator